jgi:hypothetical protein
MEATEALFKELPATLILEAHFSGDEISQLRTALEQHGCRLTQAICDARLIITKLTQEKRIRREISGLLRESHPESETSSRELDVVRAKWIRQCLVEGKLIDYPFKDMDTTWRIVHLPPITSTSPSKSARSHDTEEPETPTKKRRTSPESSRPPISAMSPESSSSEDPSFPKHRPSPPPENSPAEMPFDPNEAFACRRYSPLVCPNQTFVDLLFEIKLARELAM